ncbi:MAG TPA: DUF6636 domain-containing protein [Burkholderiaceae bacterium]|nr:DUF6636 domain-containing protein [Burkholderiaceae bacterium]
MIRLLQAAEFVLRASVILAVSTGLANAQSAETGFKTPSGNIYCVIEPPVDNHSVSDLRCDIMQMTSKAPPAPKNCPLSWGDAFAITQDGNLAIRVCHGDTVKNDELMVLAYGTQWHQGGYSCGSETTGLTCTNAKGHGFSLSKAVQKLF